MNWATFRSDDVPVPVGSRTEGEPQPALMVTRMTATMERTGLALSIQQPWAWLIVNGYKDVENRGWSTRVRGLLDIHAGKKFDSDGYEWVRSEFPHIPLPAPEDFERGGIVGRARLTNCVQFSGSPWFFGDHGFILDSAEPLPFTPCRGQLGFFTPTLTSPGGTTDTTEGDRDPR